MRRLILMRHAKSSWTEPAADDHSRPLNDRGRRAAAQMGEWLKAQDLRPDYALVSDAVRTEETWWLLEGAMGLVPMTLIETLYAAPAAQMLGALNAAPPSGTLLILAHQPGIGALAHDLLADPPDDRDFDKFPTAAIAVIDLPIDDWAQAGWGMGELHAFVVPKTLETPRREGG